MMSNGPAFTCTQCRHRDDSAKLYLGVPGLEAEGVCLLGGIPQCGLSLALQSTYCMYALYCTAPATVGWGKRSPSWHGVHACYRHAYGLAWPAKLQHRISEVPLAKLHTAGRAGQGVVAGTVVLAVPDSTGYGTCQTSVLREASFRNSNPTPSEVCWVVLRWCGAVLCALVELGRCLSGPRPPFWSLVLVAAPTHPRPSRDSNPTL